MLLQYQKNPPARHSATVPYECFVLCFIFFNNTNNVYIKNGVKQEVWLHV